MCFTARLFIMAAINGIIVRLEARLQPNTEFTLQRVLIAFTPSAITTPKVNRFGWNLEHSECIVCDWSRQILSAIYAVATAGAPGEVLLVFLWGKQRTISPVSCRPNFTKFAHNTSIGEAVNLFDTEFQNGSVPLRSDIKRTELPAANILIPLERQLIALQHCRWEFLYNETFAADCSSFIVDNVQKTTNLGTISPFWGSYGRRTTLIDGSLESPCRVLVKCNWNSFSTSYGWGATRYNVSKFAAFRTG